MKNENSSSKNLQFFTTTTTRQQRSLLTPSGTNLTFSGVVDGVNSVTVMMGRDMEWTGGGGTAESTTWTWGASTDCFFETAAAAAEDAECAGVPDGELILRSP